MKKLFLKKNSITKNFIKKNICETLIILITANITLNLWFKPSVISALLINILVIVGLGIFVFSILLFILNDEQYGSLKNTTIDFKTFYTFYNNQNKIKETINFYKKNTETLRKQNIVKDCIDKVTDNNSFKDFRTTNNFESIEDLLDRCKLRDSIKYRCKNGDSLKLGCNINSFCSAKIFNLVNIFEEKGAKYLIYLKLFKIINKDDIWDIINLDSCLYEYKNSILKELETISCISYVSDNYKEMADNRTVILKASVLNSDIYKLDEELTDKYMCENLYNTWFLMTILNMIDNNMVIDEKLINTLMNIETIVSKNKKESLKVNDSIDISYKNKKKEIWSKQIDDFETLTNSIKNDIR